METHGFILLNIYKVWREFFCFHFSSAGYSCWSLGEFVGHLIETHRERKRVLVWGFVCVHVCVRANWRGGRAGKPPVQVQSRAIRDAPSASRRASEGFRQGRGRWRVRASHPAGLLLRSGAGNLDRKLDLCPAKPGQWSSPGPGLTAGERGWTQDDQYVFLFSHCTDPLLCDQLRPPWLLQMLHRLLC